MAYCNLCDKPVKRSYPYETSRYCYSHLQVKRHFASEHGKFGCLVKMPSMYGWGCKYTLPWKLKMLISLEEVHDKRDKRLDSRKISTLRKYLQGRDE